MSSVDILKCNYICKANLHSPECLVHNRCCEIIIFKNLSVYLSCCRISSMQTTFFLFDMYYVKNRHVSSQSRSGFFKCCMLNQLLEQLGTAVHRLNNICMWLVRMCVFLMCVYGYRRNYSSTQLCTHLCMLVLSLVRPVVSVVGAWTAKDDTSEGS